MKKKPEQSKENMFAHAWMQPGKMCWIEVDEKQKSQDAFNIGQIISFKEDYSTAEITYIKGNGPTTLASNILQEKNEEEEDVEDMINLAILNDAELLYHVGKRFSSKLIYTYIGPTLLALNPYKVYENQIGMEPLLLFQEFIKNGGRIDELRTLPPCIYAISAEIWLQLLQNEKNQALVISGESGAGKTENIKFAMKFLTMLSVSQATKGQLEKKGIEERILKCNPILEAFGNAKTVRNDNSSRFGKYVTLYVNKKTWKIQGAETIIYMLEKSRIPSQAEGERCYHIFYHFLRGMSEEMLFKYNLIEKGHKLDFRLYQNKFNFLKQSKCFSVKTIDDIALYEEVAQSFKDMSFSDEEMDVIWNIIASVLLLGNIAFDDSTLTNSMHKFCIKFCQIHHAKVSKMLNIKYQALENALVYKTRKMQSEVFNSPIPIKECNAARFFLIQLNQNLQIRDTLAKELYEKLFIWLVNRLNQTILPEEMLQEDANIPELKEDYLQIGLLDIFGFECFKLNSFEQFCINFTNEKLQQLYIFYMYKTEEKEYSNENLKEHFKEITYTDNKQIIELMEKPPTGIYLLIDQAGSMKQTDTVLISQIIKQHSNVSTAFTTNKFNKNVFIVKHSAKDVEYTIDNFIQKNNDELENTIIEAITNSSSTLIQLIYNNAFLDLMSEGSATKKFLGAKFRNQINDLMNELAKCECHFVRCVKPNETKTEQLFVSALCLQQIRYMGLLESLKIRKQIYPIRYIYKTFVKKYWQMDYHLKPFDELVKMNVNFREITIKQFLFYFNYYGIQNDGQNFSKND